jgi:acyl-CoA hydrolase
MEVGVEVLSEDPRTGERRRCCDAFLTFVALGGDGRPTAVRPLRPESEEEIRRAGEAGVRREARLALREALRARGGGP